MNLILGTAQLMRNYGVTNRRGSSNSIDEAVGLLKKAEELGFYAVDTASIYGEAEIAIGLSGINLEVHTKLDPELEVEQSLEKSLLSLNRDQLDLVYIHNPEVLFEDDDHTLSSLNRYKGQMIRRIGVSIYTQREFLQAANDDRLDVVQVPHNLYDRRFEFGKSGNDDKPDFSIYARSIFLQGLLLLNPAEYPQQNHVLREYGYKIDEILSKYGISRLNALIGFEKIQTNFDGMIVGIDSVADLEEIHEIYETINLENELVSELLGFPAPEESDVDPRNWK